jgi:hypothetical protein
LRRSSGSAMGVDICCHDTRKHADPVKAVVLTAMRNKSSGSGFSLGKISRPKHHAISASF